MFTNVVKSTKFNKFNRTLLIHSKSTCAWGRRQSGRRKMVTFLFTDLWLWSSYLMTLDLGYLIYMLSVSIERICKKMLSSISWEIRPRKLGEVSDVLKWAYFMEMIHCSLWGKKKEGCFLPKETEFNYMKNFKT